jgi:hypothetical protein
MSLSLKCVHLAIAIAVTIQTPCFADATKFSAQDRKALEDAARFHEIASTKDLPDPIRKLCAEADGKMADPGGKWQVTDVIMEPSLPIRRLIWAATDGNYYVVCYERGGIVHSFHLVIATLAKGATKPTEIWAGNTKPNEFKDYAAFVASLKAGKVG